MADALQLLCLDVLADHDLDPPDGFFDPASPAGPCTGPPPTTPDDRQSTPNARADAATTPGPADRPPRTPSAAIPETPPIDDRKPEPDGLFPLDDPPHGPSGISSPPHLAHSPPRARRASTPPGADPASPPPGRPERAASSAERRFAERRHTGGNRRRPRQIVVRVDHTALVRGHIEGEETCEIPGIGPVPVSVVREWCQDAVLRVIVTKGVDVVAISTDTRYVAADVQRALDARDPECVVPSCHARHHLQNHHWRLDYAKGSPTDIDHLARTCPTHHALITHCRWTLTGGPGHWQFDPPSG